MKKIITLLFFYLITMTSFSNKRNVPGTYATIQLALNSCNTGDTVLVQPGTYSEHLVWPNIGKIKLFSSGDSSNTIIDATLNGRCVSISQPSFGLIDTTTIIKGFKLRNGYSDTITFNGVAVYASNASIKLLDLAICNHKLNILNSTGGYLGGVCYLKGGYTSIVNCSVYSNSVICVNATCEGVIVSTDHVECNNFSAFNNTIDISSTSGYLNCTGLLFTTRVPSSYSISNFKNLKISNNLISVSSSTTAGLFGGLFAFMDNSGANSFNVDNTLMTNNTFSIGANVAITGLLCYSRLHIAFTYLNIKHSTFTHNFLFGATSLQAKSLEVYGYGGTSSNCGNCMKNINIYNSIFWNPTITTTGPEIYAYNQFYGSTYLLVHNSDINSGIPSVCNSCTNNITQNPQFVSATDFHLQSSSPCINAGDSAIKVPFDLDNNTRPINIFPDTGCFEYNPSLSVLNEVIGNKLNYIIYPNPTKDLLNVNLNPQFIGGNIQIVDAIGKVLQTQTIKNTSEKIDLNLNSGIYFIKATTKDGVSKTEKLVIE